MWAVSLCSQPREKPCLRRLPATTVMVKGTMTYQDTWDMWGKKHGCVATVSVKIVGRLNKKRERRTSLRTVTALTISIGALREDTGTPDTIGKIVHTCSKPPENVSDVLTCARNSFGESRNRARISYLNYSYRQIVYLQFHIFILIITILFQRFSPYFEDVSGGKNSPLYSCDSIV